MFRYLSTAAVLLLFASVVAGDDKSALPTGPGPEVVLARAVDKAGTWMVHVSIPETHTSGMKNVPDPTGKTTGVIVPVEESKWFEYDLIVDGRQVRACKPDGKPIEPKDLRGRLTRPVRAVLFRGNANPDPHYLGVLRDDVIVLIAPPDRFVSRQAK